MTKLEMLANSIVSDIERGALREGDQLPSEEKLAEQHRVSVGTVQKALARLAHTGIISRQHGRGTFVSGSRMAPADLRYVRFQNVEGRDLPSYSSQIHPPDQAEGRLVRLPRWECLRSGRAHRELRNAP